MAKNNQIKKVVNGEIADADDVNQIVESAGNEGGAIPYDPTTHQRDDDGNESLGSANYPWGDLFINENASLKEIVTSTATINASVIFKHLRKVSYMKDVYTTTPDSWVGHAGQALRVRLDELGIEPASTSNVQLFTSSGTYVVPADIHEVYVTMVGGGGGGGGDGRGGGGGGQALVNHQITVTPGAAITVTVGAGGAGNTSSSDGAAGGSTSFGSVTVSGGNGSNGATGGTGGGSSLNGSGSTAGGFGFRGGNGGDLAAATGGGGGGTIFGPGTNGSTTGNNASHATANTGAGGGGGGLGNGDGGNGGSGLVIVMY